MISIAPIEGQETADRAFHDPAFWQDREVLGLIGSLDDFDLEATADPPYAGLKGLTLVTAPSA